MVRNAVNERQKNKTGRGNAYKDAWEKGEKD